MIKIRNPYRQSEQSTLMRRIVMLHAVFYLLFVLLHLLTVVMDWDPSQCEKFERHFVLDVGLIGSRPWTLLTHIYGHPFNSPWSMLMNLLLLYLTGRLACYTFKEKHTLAIYLAAAIIPALCMPLMRYLPYFSDKPNVEVQGMSTILMAFPFASYVYFPERLSYIFPIPIQVKKKYLLALSILMVFVGMASGDVASSLMKLLGACVGVGYAFLRKQGKREERPSNLRPTFTITTRGEEAVKRPSRAPKKEQKSLTDINDILEKISETGYESLTLAEKRKLFEDSKKSD
jgi:membrane associated rhomboid family serine protease